MRSSGEITNPGARAGLSSLKRKLARELSHLRGQIASIALVVAAGVTTVVTLRSTYTSLAHSLDAFYDDYRFGDVFADAVRAPEPLRDMLAAIPGVSAVDTRISQLVSLDVPGLDETGTGLILSIPPEDDQTLNDIYIVTGRYPEPAVPDEVLVSESFATANQLRAGMRLGAVINGRARSLQIVGVAISPDFIGELAPGTVFPDDRRFGIIRMNRDALAAATGMAGSFNQVSLRLDPSVAQQEVISKVDRVLAPFGGGGAYGRKDHPSHQAVIGELDQNRVMGTVIPMIFLGVAAFLINIVLGRLVGTQREVIGVLKAFGYSNQTIAIHYLGYALVAVVLGTTAGAITGAWLGSKFTLLYGRFFRFPDLQYVIDWKLISASMLISMAAACIGALAAVRRAVRLPPADAMRPDSPPRYTVGLIEKSGLHRLLSASGRMIARNVERQPAKTLMAAAGVGSAVAILVVSMFLFDAVERMLDVQFRQVQREDLAISFTRLRPTLVRYDLAHMPGVMDVELVRTVPVRLHNGAAQRSTAITAFDGNPQLRRIVDMEGRIADVPSQGLLLSSTLAALLRVREGDTVRVQALEGKRNAFDVVVNRTVDDFFGVSAYMDDAALHQLLGESPAASGAFLRIDPQFRETVNRQIKAQPLVSSAYSPQVLRATFEKQMAENLFISVTFLVSLSAILAVGVIYNGARIALSERGRELASLRVLGFTRTEVSSLLLGEQGVVTAVAVPIGWLLGFGLGAAVLSMFNSERYRIPMVITPRTYVYSAAIVVVSALLAGLAVRRRINRLDIIAVLKTRE